MDTIFIDKRFEEIEAKLGIIHSNLYMIEQIIGYKLGDLNSILDEIRNKQIKTKETKKSKPKMTQKEMEE